MAKNFVQEGQTISITNTGAAVIESGDPVVLGSLLVVSLVDIAPNETGTGMAKGYSCCRKSQSMRSPPAQKCISRTVKSSWRLRMPWPLALPGKLPLWAAPSLK